MSRTLEYILQQKGSHAWSLPPTATVLEAIKMMADKGVGALVVVSEGRLVGIVSERDYARKVILQGRHSRDTPVCDIMTTPVTVVTPAHSVDDCMRIVSERHIRHLPVMNGQELVGVVSIRDLVESIIEEQGETIEHLHSYITGQYPG